MDNNNNKFKKMDKFIKEHNEKRKIVDPIVMVIIIGIALYIAFRVGKNGIYLISYMAYMIYRLIKYIREQ